jgi:1-aminocyclopropane-1-carboxylate deaminase/D-cysteine desulfhydrase-like pyridoxal-dependent ACC family enzyme
MKNSFDGIKLQSIIDKEISEDAAILQNVKLPGITKAYTLYLKREDLIHPIISGNKWRKLKYNLKEANKLGEQTLLTFGGAFSNHIYATAGAGKIFGFNTIGVIRGEEHIPLNPTLQFATDCGMELFYLDRTTYRKKTDPQVLQKLKSKFGQFYLVPEGGTNQLAIKGASEIIKNLDADFDYVLSACGTGGTLSGIICGLNGSKKIIGIPVLKGARFLIDDIKKYVKEFSGKTFSNWTLDLNYHFGGYAKITKELAMFLKDFESINSVQLDPIYTGKLLLAVREMLKKNEFIENPTIIAIHTGGLQGIKGMKNKMDKLLS